MKIKILFLSVMMPIIAITGVAAMFLYNKDNPYSFASSQFEGKGECEVRSEIFFEIATLRDRGFPQGPIEGWLRGDLGMDDEAFYNADNSFNLSGAMNAIYGQLSEIPPAEIREKSFSYCMSTEE